MGKVITAVNKGIHNLTIQKKTIKNTSVRTSTKEHYNKSLATIRNRLKTLERSIRKKQRWKFIRDNIRYENNLETTTKKNKRFSKQKIQQKKTEKRKKYKHNRNQRITDIKNNLTDQNAIN